MGFIHLPTNIPGHLLGRQYNSKVKNKSFEVQFFKCKPWLGCILRPEENYLMSLCLNSHQHRALAHSEWSVNASCCYIHSYWPCTQALSPLEAQCLFG